MTLQHIDLNDLTVSPLNARKYGAKDCTDLVTSIRSLGILQPLLVREAVDGFEVIAGQRRLNACRILAEDGDIDPIPCLVMAEGDDAAAIEASLAENIERRPMDEIDQCKAFTKLVKQGRCAEEIATTFGITERMVQQRLALGTLRPPILTAYREDETHTRDIRVLTMASRRQQTAWWALAKDDGEYAPTGQRLKDWLFGEASHVLPSGHWSDSRPSVHDTFALLNGLEDADVTRILTFLMVESLAVGADIVEVLADDCEIDMSAAWSVDETFWSLLRDKETLNGMVVEMAGEAVAKEHITSTAKTHKAVIKACLDGTRVSKVENWTPRYMHVPIQGYTERSGFDYAPHTEPVEIPAISAE